MGETGDFKTIVLAAHRGSRLLGCKTMQYRVFLFDRENRVVTAVRIICKTDDDALARVSKLVTGEFGVEVWKFGTIVGTLHPATRPNSNRKR